MGPFVLMRALLGVPLDIFRAVLGGLEGCLRTIFGVLERQLGDSGRLRLFGGLLRSPEELS
eukprot:7151799-Pyramimonas_sp.AAC.1